MIPRTGGEKTGAACAKTLMTPAKPLLCRHKEHELVATMYARTGDQTDSMGTSRSVVA